MAVSQKDIARRIGVDRTLVAHALRGDPRVADATRQRVEEVAAEMGYSSYSNMAARSLSGRKFGRRPKTGMIVVMAGARFEDMPIFEVPFIKSLLLGIEREVIRQELDLALCTSYHDRAPRFISEKSVDGVICLHHWPDEIRVIQAMNDLPVLRVGDYTPGEWSLTVREKEGMRAITRHLTDQGHRKIAYLGDVREGCPDRSAPDKYEGYLQALGEAGIAPDEKLIDLRLEEPMVYTGRIGMERLLSRTRDFTAVVCHNDSIAMGALQTAERHGLSVPEDFSLVGFDDVTEHYNCNPLLTSVGYDRVAMGRRAVELIYEKLNATDAAYAPDSESFPTRVVERASTRSLSAGLG